MEIIVYLFLLILCEVIVYCLIIGIDYYMKSKKGKLVKRCIIMIKSKFDKNNNVSIIAYWVQIFNYLYVLIYILIAIIETFIYRSPILASINIYSVGIYFIFAFISLIIVSILDIIP